MFFDLKCNVHDKIFKSLKKKTLIQLLLYLPNLHFLEVIDRRRFMFCIWTRFVEMFVEIR